MKALCGSRPRRIVVNTQNLGSIAEIEAGDIIEVPCRISDDTITPEPCGTLPEAVRGLVLAVKAYERAAIEAALSGSELTARKAMLLYPAIGEWEPSRELLKSIDRPLLADPDRLVGKEANRAQTLRPKAPPFRENGPNLQLRLFMAS